jgi:hypothetical protein
MTAAKASVGWPSVATPFGVRAQIEQRLQNRMVGGVDRDAQGAAPVGVDPVLDVHAALRRQVPHLRHVARGARGEEVLGRGRLGGRRLAPLQAVQRVARPAAAGLFALRQQLHRDVQRLRGGPVEVEPEQVLAAAAHRAPGLGGQHVEAPPRLVGVPADERHEEAGAFEVLVSERLDKPVSQLHRLGAGGEGVEVSVRALGDADAEGVEPHRAFEEDLREGVHTFVVVERDERRLRGDLPERRLEDH